MQIDATGITTLTASDPSSVNAKKTDAARDFEALLITQMLKSARECGSGGWMGTGEDSSSSPAVEFAEQHVAALMAASGGLGLAKAVMQGLDQPARSEPAVAQPGDAQKDRPERA